MDSLKVRSSELLDKKQKLSQINEEIKLKSNSTKFRTVQCFSIKRKLIMATLTDFFNTYLQSTIKALIRNLHVIDQLAIWLSVSSFSRLSRNFECLIST